MSEIIDSDLNQWSSIEPDRAEDFAKRGYVVIHNFTTPTMCKRISETILDYVQRKSLIEVRWENSTFDTFNGSDVDQNFHELQLLYDHQLLLELQKLCTPLATVTDRRVGISINLISPGGKFQAHFDRHIMTAILYVNDDFSGGQMHFYPRIRYWLGHPSGRAKKVLQRVFDKIVRGKPYLKLLAKRVALQPQTGDLLIFEGTRTYHAVTPVTGGNRRISVQFAYDRPGATFNVSQYYGK